ncbi:LysR family transcriptional regulator [Crocosphaera sp. XPORK-15E]|uniref:LysR family transcriptional regulator n=1 Tax=Crocosphaera sp. XPORK-15E TaxID=3110247 RepID=UPI002B21A638|nr:LysR family transcriptional regulator [Crocosphaera sp. XPORK-15E]MEA5536730.1 LysR family transcriptional regulator [Crocosphaera sp. XPORK-15E]
MLKFSMEFNYPNPSQTPLKVGTLGPNNTSSGHTLNYLASQWQAEEITVTPCWFDSFTELKDSLLDNKVDLALVPHAYERINDFYMEPQFKLRFVFTYPTPVYGLAKRKNSELVTENCTIVTHPAPFPLLPYLLPNYQDKINIKVKFVNSTSIAALELKEGLADLAITNEQALKDNDLEFIAIYGKIDMSWSIFQKQSLLS